MKKRINISISEALHAEAVLFSKGKDMALSQLVCLLLREAMKAQAPPIATIKDAAGESHARPVEIPPGTRLLDDRPSKNRPCPCGSGEKYKKCCEPHFPLMSTHPRPLKSCIVPNSLTPSRNGIQDEQDD